MVVSEVVGLLGAGLDLFDAAVLAAFLLVAQLAARIGMWTYCFAVLPGTLMHELAHYFVALVLRARPKLPSLLPEKTPYGWRLGSVDFRAGILRSVPIALAPFALAPLGLLWASATLPELAFGGEYLLHAWGASTTFSASLPSRQDWKIAAPALLLGAMAILVAQL